MAPPSIPAVRIALVRYRYTPHGGAERYLDALARGLLSMGAQVRILSSSWESRAPGAVPVEAVRVPAKPAPLRVLGDGGEPAKGRTGPWPAHSTGFGR